MIELVISAGDRKQLVERTRALDRVLLANRYVIPNWHLPASRVVYWDKFGIPDTIPSRGPVIGTWWIDTEKLQRLNRAMQAKLTIDGNGVAVISTATDSVSDDELPVEIQQSDWEFDWLSAVFPLLILSVEILVFVKIHRYLHRRKRNSLSENSNGVSGLTSDTKGG